MLMYVSFPAVNFLRTVPQVQKREKIKVVKVNFTPYSCSDGEEMYQKARCTCRAALLIKPIQLLFDVLVVVVFAEGP